MVQEKKKILNYIGKNDSADCPLLCKGHLYLRNESCAHNGSRYFRIFRTLNQLCSYKQYAFQDMKKFYHFYRLSIPTIPT